MKCSNALFFTNVVFSQFTYKFSDLKSLDPSTLYDPLLSIPIMGFVPKKKSGWTKIYGFNLSSCSCWFYLRVSKGISVQAQIINDAHYCRKCYNNWTSLKWVYMALCLYWPESSLLGLQETKRPSKQLLLRILWFNPPPQMTKCLDNIAYDTLIRCRYTIWHQIWKFDNSVHFIMRWHRQLN